MLGGARLPALEHGPGDARVFRRNGDTGAVITTSFPQRERPLRERIGLFAGSLQHRAGTEYQERSQIPIPATGDLPEPRLAARGVLLWHHAEPGHYLASVLEFRSITKIGDVRRSGHRADAHPPLNELRTGVGSGVLRNLAAVFFDPLIEDPHMIQQIDRATPARPDAPRWHVAR